MSGSPFKNAILVADASLFQANRLTPTAARAAIEMMIILFLFIRISLEEIIDVERKADGISSARRRRRIPVVDLGPVTEEVVDYEVYVYPFPDLLPEGEFPEGVRAVRLVAADGF